MFSTEIWSEWGVNEAERSRMAGTAEKAARAPAQGRGGTDRAFHKINKRRRSEGTGARTMPRLGSQWDERS